jgi:beta-N-acetylhexosaminidase
MRGFDLDPRRTRSSMTLLLALVRLAIAAALLWFAVDWRSPYFASVRGWALCGFILIPLAIIGGEVVLLTAGGGRRGNRMVRAVGVTTLALAIVALNATLWFEAQFHWMRHHVLAADPQRLEALGHHVIVGYRDLAELRALIERRAVAGVFLGARNVRGKTIAEIRALVAELQAVRRQQQLPPLWIATDQEGGPVSRLSPPLERSPSLAELVEAHPDTSERTAAVQALAARHGRDLADLGVNVNFAPVVDLNHRIVNPDDHLSRIHERAISADPAVVTEVASRYCAGLDQAGVRCTLKHFPGLGRVFEDTHREDADLAVGVTELTATDWVPFRALMQHSGTFTMLAHVRLTALDRERPVSSSQPVVAGLVRRDWQHDGILVTDDFCMAAAYGGSGGMAAASVGALNAGVDLILVSYDPDQFYPVMYALLQAHAQGHLRRDVLAPSERRLARSAPAHRTATAVTP